MGIKRLIKVSNIRWCVSSINRLISITVTFVAADRPLTLINQACVLAVVCVLLGSAVIE